MTARQEHRTAAGLAGHRPGLAVIPRPDAVPVVHLGVEQIADRAGSQQRLDVLEQRVPAQHETDDAADAGLFHRVAQGAVLFHRDGHRLLDEDVFSGTGGGDALSGVDVVRPAEVHHVHFSVGQNRIEVVAGRTVQAHFVDQPLGSLASPATDRDYFHVRIFLPACGMSVGHFARTVNGHSQLSVFHDFAPR